LVVEVIAGCLAAIIAFVLNCNRNQRWRRRVALNGANAARPNVPHLSAANERGARFFPSEPVPPRQLQLPAALPVRPQVRSPTYRNRESINYCRAAGELKQGGHRGSANPGSGNLVLSGITMYGEPCDLEELDAGGVVYTGNIFFM
jgi:hypothetical protein